MEALGDIWRMEGRSVTVYGLIIEWEGVENGRMPWDHTWASDPEESQ